MAKQDASVTDHATRSETDEAVSASEPIVQALKTEPVHTSSSGLRHFAAAASVALAAVLGGLAGAGAASVFSQPAPVPVSDAPMRAAAAETKALREAVTKLSGDLALLQARLDASHKTASTQLSKVSERLERLDKAQAEPAAKLTKLGESLDKIERHMAAAPSPEVTGSVSTTVPKTQSRPPLAEGWRLHEFSAGRAVVQSRTGDIYEIEPGSNLPGLGRVQSIKRAEGRLVIVTPKGIISTPVEARPANPFFMPYPH
jgi:hypothetical protein